MHLKEITLIGAGRLGGSIGLALRQRQGPVKVRAHVRRLESVAECQRLSDQEIGLRCDLPPDKVSNVINNAARKFRTELRGVIAEYAAGQGEIEEELRDLIQILRNSV